MCLRLLLQASSVYEWLCFATSMFVCAILRNSPCHHYEEVQAVPRVSKVTLLTKNPQSHHLDHHLDGKECKDEVIEVLQRNEDTGIQVNIL